MHTGLNKKASGFSRWWKRIRGAVRTAAVIIGAGAPIIGAAILIFDTIADATDGDGKFWGVSMGDPVDSLQAGGIDLGNVDVTPQEEDRLMKWFEPFIKNAYLPILTSVSPQLANLVSGSSSYNPFWRANRAFSELENFRTYCQDQIVNPRDGFTTNENIARLKAISFLIESAKTSIFEHFKADYPDLKIGYNKQEIPRIFSSRGYRLALSRTYTKNVVFVTTGHVAAPVQLPDDVVVPKLDTIPVNPPIKDTITDGTPKISHIEQPKKSNATKIIGFSLLGILAAVGLGKILTNKKQKK